jgi:tRNA(adenine34) deaminase
MHRRIVLAGGATMLAAAAVGTRPASARTAPALPEDTRFMQMAIDDAIAAAVGFAAVIVKDGAVLARGANRTAPDRDPTAHGEMVAIRAALAAHGPEALRGTTLYTTGEPCCMCMGAILWCGIGRVVFAASLSDIKSRFDQIGLSAADVAAAAPFAPIALTGGVLNDAAVPLLK